MIAEPTLKTAGKRYKAALEMDVFEAARTRMDYVYTEFDDVVVSWSGGKDSSTCLELARESARKLGRLPIKVFFLDEEVVYPETLDLCYRHIADPEIDFYWVCVPSLYRNACSEKEPDFIPFDPKLRDLWTHVPPASAIWPAGFDENGLPNMTNWRVPPSIPKRAISEMFGSKEKKVASITGLRAQESFVRYSGVMSSASFISKPEHGFYGVRPIYDWKAGDIWLAIKENGWDYNKAYDKLWRAGGNPISTRVAPLFHAEAAMNLRKVMLFWPQLWPLVKRRVRGAHAVAINNGRLHAVERWGNETWKEAAERYLNGLGSEFERNDMHNFVGEKLNQHLRHSGETSFSMDKPCPECRLSWKLVAKAVARGDRQHRMLQPNKTITPMNKKPRTKKEN